FVEGMALYKEFHLDEPWDSEHNRKLIPRMPNIYASPNVQTANGTTLYLGVAGPGAIFGEDKALTLRNIVDGTSKTIMVVEADADRAVPWSKPDDLHYNPDEPASGLGHLRPGGFLALFGDAHVTMISEAIAPDMLKALFTYAGREPVVFPGE